MTDIKTPESPLETVAKCLECASSDLDRAMLAMHKTGTPVKERLARLIGNVADSYSLSAWNCIARDRLEEAKREITDNFQTVSALKAQIKFLKEKAEKKND